MFNLAQFSQNVEFGRKQGQTGVDQGSRKTNGNQLCNANCVQWNSTRQRLRGLNVIRFKSIEIKLNRRRTYQYGVIDENIVGTRSRLVFN